MNTVTHGLSIGIENTGNEFFLKMKAVGKLTHEDYEVITPIIDSALDSVKDPKVSNRDWGSHLQSPLPKKISKDEVDEISSLFFDGKTSAKLLHEHADKYIS